MELRDFFQECPKVALGFSGGVDSAYLLYAALDHGAQVRPYFIKTAFQPQFELEDARRLCAQLGVELTVVELDVLQIPGVAENPPDRCYHCKRALFGRLRQQALADGYTVLIDGTNASDDAGNRPGMRALGSCPCARPCGSAASPRPRCGLSPKRRGCLPGTSPPTPAWPPGCPPGRPSPPETLRKVEAAEEALFSLGYSDLRVRVFHGAARLQLPGQQLEQAAKEREAILQALAPWFDTVLLDLKER